VEVVLLAKFLWLTASAKLAAIVRPLDADAALVQVRFDYLLNLWPHRAPSRRTQLVQSLKQLCWQQQGKLPPAATKVRLLRNTWHA
jgi:hypothetical protein